MLHKLKQMKAIISEGVYVKTQPTQAPFCHLGSSDFQ